MLPCLCTSLRYCSSSRLMDCSIAGEAYHAASAMTIISCRFRNMGQLSKAERDLLQKLMKAREGRDSTVKPGKVT